MKNLHKILVFTLMISLLPGGYLFAQVDEDDDDFDYSQYMVDESKDQFVRRTFNAPTLINSQTAQILNKKTLEFMIQHRFGLLNKSVADMFGIYAPANIRMGFNYGVTGRITLGVGSTKFNNLIDVNWKGSILRQTESGSMPVSLSYYGNSAINIKDASEDLVSSSHRFSYFHQLSVQRKFNDNLSLFLTPAFMHFNLVDSSRGYVHDNISITAGGKYSISPQSSLLFEAGQGQLLTKANEGFSAKPGVSLGIEVATTAHSFQVFATTFRNIIEQQNYNFNTYDFTRGELLIGFNITRNWNF